MDNSSVNKQSRIVFHPHPMYHQIVLHEQMLVLGVFLLMIQNKSCFHRPLGTLHHLSLLYQMHFPSLHFHVLHHQYTILDGVG
jgi:hypothetical protein